MGEMAAKASSERKLLVALDLGATRWQFAATDGRSGKVTEASLGRATVAEGKATLLDRLSQAPRPREKSDLRS
jgi:hypothetical protein